MTEYQRSLIAKALKVAENEQEGIMKRNAKKDRIYNAQIDNIIYETCGKRKQIENVIVMPMLNSRQEVLGVIELANTNK